MTLDLEYREGTRTDFDLGMLGGVKMDYDRLVFRRYHVDTVGKPLNETNPYLYAKNNPLNWVDPSGMGPVTFGACVALTLADAIDTGYDLSKVLDRVQELKKEKVKRENRCSDETLPSDQRQRNEIRLDEINKEITKLSSQVNKSAFWGTAKAGALVFLCGLALTPGF